MAKNIDLTPDKDSVNQKNRGEEKQSPTPNSPSHDRSLTVEEVQDANKVKVVISDPSPIIIMFGARSSGKTMTLIRLTRWLKKQGYKVEPDRNFRPSNSIHYKEMCDTFAEAVNSDYSAGRNTILDFMLIKVMNEHGEPICQILEAPGEHYFDEEFPDKQFPRYINEIRTIDNPRTWMFIVESGWKDQQDRSNYANKIIKMQTQIELKDKVIFTCHKADIHSALFSHGKPNRKQFFKNISNEYPGIFSKYMNHNPIRKLWSDFKFDFVVFSSGLFNDLSDGGQSYTQSNDRYPAKLWKAIMTSVRGSWKL